MCEHRQICISVHATNPQIMLTHVLCYSYRFRCLHLRGCYSGRSRIVLRVGGGSFSCPKIWWPFFRALHSRSTYPVNSTPLNPSLLPQPPFTCHPRRFTSPKSTCSLQELLQKIFCLWGGFVRAKRTPSPGSAPVLAIFTEDNLVSCYNFNLTSFPQYHEKSDAFELSCMHPTFPANRL